uniref:hypothetical protein n=1 Tax=Prevotella sp. TaxID=59823 RepID=UPI0027E25E9B
AITLFAEYSAIRHTALNSITSLISITSELAKVQYIMYDVAVDLKVAVVIAARRDEYRSIHATE